jgi:hypothetical protein
VKSLRSIWQWARNKCGRIVSAAGILLSGVETLDISPIKDPLEGIIGHKGVLWVTCGLFAASWFRHQWVANQHPGPVAVPDPQAGAVVKP